MSLDGFVPYIGAVERAWGVDALDFGQLVTIYGATVPGPACYAPAKIVEAIPTVVHGSPDPTLISSRHIEQPNLTIRMACRRFTRLTNAFSKTPKDFKAARLQGCLGVAPRVV